MKDRLIIPVVDKAEFATYPAECRKEVNQLLRVMERLLAHKGKGIGKAIECEAALLGMSPSNLRKLYDEYRIAHDWRKLVNRRKYPPPADAKLPGEFIEQIWKPLVEDNQRKCKPAWRALIRFWKTGVLELHGKLTKFDKVPGYEEGWPDAAPGHGHPAGWSYKNLQDRYNPTRFEITAMRDGLGAALAQFGPKVLTTRVGLWVGSHYVADDVLRDFRVLLLGANAIARIQELGALDLFSGNRFAVFRRPQYMVDGVKDSIKEREMRFFVAAILHHNGYSPLGTQFVTEKGTAAIRKMLAEFLGEHSNGLITVREPGITGREQAIAGFWGSGGGNPRHKAPVESLHNLLQNEAANLPAATGHDRNEPEWLFGLEAITKEVIRDLATLPPEQSELLIAPACEYWQGVGLLEEIDRRINARTDHNLEGWRKLGFARVEYRLDITKDEWFSNREFLTLPAPAQQLVMTAAQSDKRYMRVRQLSPAEVYAEGSHKLIKFPSHVIALMFADERLGMDLREPKDLSADGAFHFSASKIDPEEMIFEGFVNTSCGETILLKEKVTWSVVLNPFDRNQLWVYEPKGGFLGTAVRRNRVCQTDEEGMKRALGQRSHAIKTLLTPLRERHAGAAAEIARISEHNRRVREGLPVTAEAMAKERALRRLGSSSNGSAGLEQMAEPEPAAIHAPEPIQPEPKEFSADGLL